MYRRVLLRAFLLSSLLVATADIVVAEEVRTLSGGVGASSQEELLAQQSEYSLKLVFAETGGAFLADVGVQIADASGTVLVDAVSRGPWFLADLPAGHYRVTATFAGKGQGIDVAVPAAGLREVTLRRQSAAAE